MRFDWSLMSILLMRSLADPVTVSHSGLGYCVRVWEQDNRSKVECILSRELDESNVINMYKCVRVWWCESDGVRFNVRVWLCEDAVSSDSRHISLSWFGQTSWIDCRPRMEDNQPIGYRGPLHMPTRPQDKCRELSLLPQGRGSQVCPQSLWGCEGVRYRTRIHKSI